MRGSIPDDLKSAVAEIAKVCGKYNLRFCQAEVKPGFDNEFHDSVHMAYHHNPHGSKPSSVRIRYEKWESIDIAIE